MNDFIKRIKKSIASKNAILFFISSCAVYLLLHNFIQEILSKIIVDPVFSTINSAWYNDLIFVCVAIWGIVFFISKWRNYIPSLNTILLLIFCSLIYLSYRIAGSVWEFTGFKLYKNFKYADVFLVIVVVNVLLYVFRKKGVLVTDSKNYLFDDASLGETQNDELGYSKYALNVSSRIRNSHFKKSFAIGINGKWGSGKTSFIDLIKRNLTNENIISLDFNPWNSYTPQAIIKDFFDTLQEAIRPYHSSLAELLVQYSNKLVSLNENSVTKSFQASVLLLSGHDSLNSLFNNINQSIQDINKKVVIYIDDLDRLDKEEIVEVIRLIRNTANFFNTFFVVAYDKNYISNALKNHNAYSHNQFLEKIFQLEITLPYYKKQILIRKLSEKLKELLDEKYHDKIDEALIGTSAVAPIQLGDWLDTMRDVTRLANSIIINISNLLEEIDVSDFIRIEILRLKYTSVYEILFKQKQNLFKTSDSGGGVEMKYELVYGKDQFDTIEDGERNEKYLKIYLKRHAVELNIPLSEIEHITAYVQGIFPDSLTYGYYSRKHLSIVYASKFDRYFSYALFEDELSEIEFLDAIELGQAELNTKISEWVSNGLTYEVQKRFMNIKSFSNKEEFEKIITAIFHLANHPNKVDYYPFVLGYDGKDLFDKLTNYNGRLAETLYESKGGSEGLRTFIKSLFEQAKLPFAFEAEYAKFVNAKLFDETMFPLTKEEMKNISIGYLKEYCNHTSNFDMTVFFLLWNTEQTDYTSLGGGGWSATKNIPHEAKEIIKSFINKHVDEFIMHMIEIEPLHQRLFTVAKSTEIIYDRWDNFKAFLTVEDENKWEYLSEFKSFYNEAEKSNFSKYVPFDFKVIPIESKRRSS